ncbi:cysteine-S-conjugate beta-lyase [Malassezia brasiliensis]|uniref:Cystathionine beta-lyase n=1 Tax=Malassezia brasiliensis TaxID=1821822 RepID=A0AAF0IN89_9BASI|nr:cysteine-S-conjugate beta-lyase [Malassezia brasiliensis]
MPVYLTATFKGLPGAEFDYSRSGNPTRTVLQNHLSQLQGCKHTYALATGMASLDVITRLVRSKERIVAGNDLYGGTNRLLGILRTTYDIQADHIDTTNATVFERHLQACAEDHAEGRAGPVTMVLLESPTNPLIQICDIALYVRIVRKYVPEALIVVDNTMLSPYLMRPLEMGVDIVYDSGTKYLSGHHDVMAGVIATNRDDLAERIYFLINSVGNALSPMDCFLLLRGVKTLALRMDRMQTNAMQVAHFLHQLGFHVNYPGLRSHPGYAIHRRLARGPGSVMSFETGDKELSARIVAAVKLWGVSVSFGCINSLISMPCLMSHASIDPKVRAERGMPENLIRVCVGIEDVHDLLADLTQALVTAGAIRARSQREDGTVEYERVPVQDEMEVLRAQLRASSLTQTSAPAVPTSLVVSAPGKVILFGEHAVVHGVTAIAAATALRCYGRVTPRADQQVKLEMPDIGLSIAWAIDALPWGTVTSAAEAPRELDPALIARLVPLTQQYPEGDRRQIASLAFLYLYVHLASASCTGQTFELRSSLPISAGLGSSAAVSTCLASMMLYTHARLTLPADATAGVPGTDITTVNRWAFLSEKVIHGQPSGVDNTVATHGGAIAFTRAVPGNALEHDQLTPINGFDALRLLITDTCVSRNTKSLVAGVSAQKDNDPERVQAAFDTIQLIADEAQALLEPKPGTEQASRTALLARFGRLIDLNHLQLVQLGVGHTALERVRTTCRGAPYHLHTKLTGAGGGGCAITLVRDDMSSAQMDALLQSLATHGFTTYETEVGGPGLGVLAQPAPDGTAQAHQFIEMPAPQLAAWASASGTWAFA